MSHIVHHSIQWCASVFLSAVVFTRLRYAEKRIFNNIIMKVYIERNNLQLQLIRYSIFFTYYLNLFNTHKGLTLGLLVGGLTGVLAPCHPLRES